MDQALFDARLAERFWSKVDRSQLGPAGCWPWLGHCNDWGYGIFGVKATRPIKMGSAHRVSFQLEHGRPPAPGMKVLHRCDYPPCVQPAHLFEGTQKQNVQDCLEKGRFVAGGLSPEIASAKRKARRHLKSRVANGVPLVTGRQGDLLVALAIRSAEGEAPSDRELAEALGVSSPHSIMAWRGVLRSKGLVDWLPGQRRTVSLTPLGDKFASLIAEIESGAPIRSVS